MASQVGQRLEDDGTYAIQIRPEGSPPSNGEVQDSAGALVKPWSYAGMGQVWVNVGQHRGGKLTEGGHATTTWKIISIG